MLYLRMVSRPLLLTPLGFRLVKRFPALAQLVYARKSAMQASSKKSWDLLRNADQLEMEALLYQMIDEFDKDCVKRNAEKLFRIHWDGDFFNETYTHAWKNVIKAWPSIQFWVYTRSDFAIPILTDVDNLSIYFSTDDDNWQLASELKKTNGVKLAYLANNFAMGKERMLSITPKSAIPCPENAKKLPLISDKGSACVTCGQCVFARNDILFSASKK
jgi:hypothetical protein